MVYIEGSLHTRKYTDQQGIERYATEIKASSMQMLSSNQDQQQSQGQQWQGQQPQQVQQQQQPPQQRQLQGVSSSNYQPMGHHRPTDQAVNVSDDDMPF